MSSAPALLDATAPTRATSGSRARKALHALLAVPNWVGHNLHNSYGIVSVFDLAWLRRMPGGLVAETHPFATGVSPNTGKSVWHDNLAFATPDRFGDLSDEETVERTMEMLRRMFVQSCSTSAHASGVPSRMPPAINYIHGSVHFNGASMLFNDFDEAVRHFTDRRFKREVWRLLRRERRDITLIFRCREYESDDLAKFSCFMKTIFPFFGNPNGPNGRIHWGVPAPYPNYNLIAGNWIRDTRALRTAEGRASAAREPLDNKAYFADGPYDRGWSGFRWPELWLCAFTTWRVRIRGSQGGVYFVDAAGLRRGDKFDPQNLPSLWARLRAKVTRVRRRPRE